MFLVVWYQYCMSLLSLLHPLTSKFALFDLPSNHQAYFLPVSTPVSKKGWLDSLFLTKSLQISNYSAWTYEGVLDLFIILCYTRILYKKAILIFTIAELSSLKFSKEWIFFIWLVLEWVGKVKSIPSRFRGLLSGKIFEI